ncbi:MAG: hypothetical protein RL033_5077 [Pseudomonadota bacterium]|jgi:AraC-like DNA-binding protein
MSDCIDSKFVPKEGSEFHDSPPESDRARGPARTLRRAWMEKDPETYARMLRELAPSTSYSSRVLARMLGITPRHLQRIFAATLRRAPQAWLNEQRLIAAKQMLRTAGTVKEVAYSLGFHSASQLSRDFKGYFGIAPSTLIEPQARLLRDAAATVGALVAAEVKRPMGESS